MKVLAFNSSPNMDKGNTALILNPFLDGLKQSGAEVDLFYTKKLNLDACQVSLVAGEGSREVVFKVMISD